MFWHLLNKTPTCREIVLIETTFQDVFSSTTFLSNIFRQYATISNLGPTLEKQVNTADGISI